MYRGVQQRRKKKSGKAKIWLLALLAILVAGAAAWFVFFRDDKSGVAQQAPPQQQNEQKEEEELPAPELVNLQPVVDKWADKQQADYAIVVYDPANEKIIASREPDRKFFAASLYKLYVAYLSLVDFQNGDQDPDEILTQGLTRKECVDKMIRESHSPCGEAMMASIGQETLRKRVAAMDINNTIFAGITTTAGDSAQILRYIVEMRDLTKENTEFLKDAMRDQPARFRGGLPKGAPKATWETKVGWNLDINYHDVGIMTLPNGRQYVVAILGQGSGSPTPIADFAATIYNALK